MDKKSINQNKAIQDGLEKFVDQEIGFYDIKPDTDITEHISSEKKTLKEPLLNDSFSRTPVRKDTVKREPVRREPVRKDLDLKQPVTRDTVKKQPVSRESSKTLKTEFASSPRNISNTQNTRGTEKNYQNSNKDYNKDYRKDYRKDFEDDMDEDLGYEKDERSYRDRNNRYGNSRNAKQAPYPVKQNQKHIKGNGKKYKQKGKKGRNPKDEKKSKVKKVLIILGIVALALFLWWYLTVGRIYSKMNFEKADELASGSMKDQGVINVLLIGNDSRENGEDGRSDAMILVSISPKTKTIHMTSLLRDMYVDIPGHDGNRLNAAYSYGGATLLCQTIEQNLGIKVNRYALVNFQAFASLVDAVGGVDLDVTNEEVQWINAYLNEYNLLEGKEMTTDYLDTSLSGNIHLNGPQALAYCRNRYIGTDFGRTERQRKVLSAVTKKLPLALATNSGELIDGLFPNVTTNLTKTECYELSLNAEKFLTYESVQSSIPAEGTYSNEKIRGMAVLRVDFDANKKILQKEIYGKEE